MPVHTKDRSGTKRGALLPDGVTLQSHIGWAWDGERWVQFQPWDYALNPVENLRFNTDDFAVPLTSSVAEITWDLPSQPVAPTETWYRTQLGGGVWTVGAYPLTDVEVSGFSPGDWLNFEVKLVRRVLGVITAESPVRSLYFQAPTPITTFDWAFPPITGGTTPPGDPGHDPALCWWEWKLSFVAFETGFIYQGTASGLGEVINLADVASLVAVPGTYELCVREVCAGVPKTWTCQWLSFGEPVVEDGFMERHVVNQGVNGVQLATTLYGNPNRTEVLVRVNTYVNGGAKLNEFLGRTVTTPISAFDTHQNSDVYLTKWDDTSQTFASWTVEFLNAAGMNAYNAVLLNDGSFVVVGWTRATSFTPQGSSIPLSGEVGTRWYFIVKYDANGNWVWQNKIGQDPAFPYNHGSDGGFSGSPQSGVVASPDGSTLYLTFCPLAATGPFVLDGVTIGSGRFLQAIIVKMNAATGAFTGSRIADNDNLWQIGPPVLSADGSTVWVSGRTSPTSPVILSGITPVTADTAGSSSLGILMKITASTLAVTAVPSLRQGNFSTGQTQQPSLTSTHVMIFGGAPSPSPVFGRMRNGVGTDLVDADSPLSDYSYRQWWIDQSTGFATHVVPVSGGGQLGGAGTFSNQSPDGVDLLNINSDFIANGPNGSVVSWSRPGLYRRTPARAFNFTMNALWTKNSEGKILFGGITAAVASFPASKQESFVIRADGTTLTTQPPATTGQKVGIWRYYPPTSRPEPTFSLVEAIDIGPASHDIGSMGGRDDKDYYFWGCSISPTTSVTPGQCDQLTQTTGLDPFNGNRHTAYLMRRNADNTVAWRYRLGNAFNQVHVTDVRMDVNGDCLVAGWALDGFTFPDGWTSPGNTASTMAWFAKVLANGTWKWTITTGRSSGLLASVTNGEQVRPVIVGHENADGGAICSFQVAPGGGTLNVFGTNLTAYPTGLGEVTNPNWWFVDVDTNGALNWQRTGVGATSLGAVGTMPAVKPILVDTNGDVWCSMLGTLDNTHNFTWDSINYHTSQASPTYDIGFFRLDPTTHLAANGQAIWEPDLPTTSRYSIGRFTLDTSGPVAEVVGSIGVDVRAFNGYTTYPFWHFGSNQFERAIHFGNFTLPALMHVRLYRNQAVPANAGLPITIGPTTMDATNLRVEPVFVGKNKRYVLYPGWVLNDGVGGNPARIGIHRFGRNGYGPAERAIAVVGGSVNPMASLTNTVRQGGDGQPELISAGVAAGQAACTVTFPDSTVVTQSGTATSVKIMLMKGK